MEAMGGEGDEIVESGQEHGKANERALKKNIGGNNAIPMKLQALPVADGEQTFFNNGDT